MPLLALLADRLGFDLSSPQLGIPRLLDSGTFDKFGLFLGDLAEALLAILFARDERLPLFCQALIETFELALPFQDFLLFGIEQCLTLLEVRYLATEFRPLGIFRVDFQFRSTLPHGMVVRNLKGELRRALEAAQQPAEVFRPDLVLGETLRTGDNFNGQVHLSAIAAGPDTHPSLAYIHIMLFVNSANHVNTS
jgi:hypothetical protein